MKILKFILPCYFTLIYSTAFSQWSQKYFTDEFGDFTKDSYIQHTDNYGTFSNSATSDAKLIVKIACPH